jgi:hypothetical protein
MNVSDFDHFQTICSRISLNIPANYMWRWDAQFDHALVVFEKEFLELIYIPIVNEFDSQWDFNSFDKAPGHIRQFVESSFGLIPGQRLFTTAMAQNDELFLYATWWPWGDNINFSLRVGLVSPSDDTLNKAQIQTLLTHWFKIHAPNQAS